MYYPRNNVTENWYAGHNFSSCSAQNFSCAPVNFMADDGINIKETLCSGFGLFQRRWSDYRIQAKGAIESFYCTVNEKKETIIDEFEEFVCKMNNTSIQTENYSNNFCCVKNDIIDNFENIVEKTKNLGLIAKNRVNKLADVKELAVDNFEELVEKSKKFSLQTTNNLRKVKSAKATLEEQAIENFEEFVDKSKDIGMKAKNCVREFKCIKETYEDDFQDFFDDTKWILEDRVDAIVGNAECAFEEFVEQMEEVFECGKFDVQSELYSLKYWLCMGEMLVKDFLCYSERMVEEFCRFSEKRLACFLCDGKQKARVFYHEVVDSLIRGFEDKLLCDNLVLEINSSRYAYNVTMSEVNFHVVRALLTLPGPDGHSWQHLVSRLTYFMPILTNYIRSEAAQKDCLLAIEDVAACNPEIFAVLVKIIHWLYEQDILCEDIILDWYNNPCSDAGPENSRRVRQQVAPFIQWLQEAEEDDDDN